VHILVAYLWTFVAFCGFFAHKNMYTKNKITFHKKAKGKKIKNCHVAFSCSFPKCCDLWTNVSFKFVKLCCESLVRFWKGAFCPHRWLQFWTKKIAKLCISKVLWFVNKCVFQICEIMLWKFWKILKGCVLSTSMTSILNKENC